MAQDFTSPAEAPVSVLLAHHHTLLREGIACLLESGGFSVVGQVETIEELKDLIPVHCPEVILLEWELPDGGAEAVESVVALVQQQAQGATAIFTRPQQPDVFLAAVKTRVDGYLSVNMSRDEFISAVHMIARGDVIISRDLAAGFKDELAADPASEAKDDLSDREREVLRLVARGATNREIAEYLTITENTVKAHLRRILEKLDLRNRYHAAAYAIQEGLVDPIVVTEELEPVEPAEPV